MNTKIIAIGNTLMKDDGIGIVVAKKIKDELEKINLEVIIGETDFNYCISKISKEDLVIIIDAACYNNNPGEVKIYTLSDYNSSKKGYTQHSLGLLELLKLYFPQVKGYIIGIEVGSVDFELGISNTLKNRLEDISKKTINIIKKLVLDNCVAS